VDLPTQSGGSAEPTTTFTPVYLSLYDCQTHVSSVLLASLTERELRSRRTPHPICGQPIELYAEALMTLASVGDRRYT